MNTLTVEQYFAILDSEKLSLVNKYRVETDPNARAYIEQQARDVYEADIAARNSLFEIQFADQMRKAGIYK